MGKHSLPSSGGSPRKPALGRSGSGGETSGPGGAGGRRDDGEWTGSHRVIAPGRRGVSFGVIAALVGVVVLVAGVILWRFFGDALSDRSETAADRCLAGEAKVAVLADPAIADNLAAAAEKFNDTAGPVGDKCVSVSVTAADSNAVLDGLLGSWPQGLGDKPALWVPASSVAPARLQAATGPTVVSSVQSLATSPVLLAVRPDLKPALAEKTWASLPALQNDPVSLDNLNLPGWGSLRLALPTVGDSDSSFLAAEAVASASAPPDSPATAGAGAVYALLAGQPELDDNSLDAAMKSLLESSDPAAAPVHAVVTTEQQLFERAAALPDTTGVIAGWMPAGPAAVADFPAVLLSGDWISQEQSSAASEFERYLREPEQLAEFAKSGFRTEGATPAGNDVTPFAPLSSTLSIDDSARVSVANSLSAPAAGQTTTSIMLDRSLNLVPLVSALNTRLAALPPTAAIGLTTFDGGQGTTQVNVGALSDSIDGRARGQLITDTLNGLGAGAGGSVSFTTLRNVYGDALTHFRPEQPNSVLVITSGPHTDLTLGSQGLQELIRSSTDPARPVAVNVINVGDDPDRPTWEAVATISGGRYQNVPNTDSPELVTALNSMLG